MLRGLILGAVALGVGLFAASLLRTEGRAAGAAGGAGADASAPPGTCAARTRSGAPCSRPAEPGSDRCWQHR